MAIIILKRAIGNYEELLLCHSLVRSELYAAM